MKKHWLNPGMIIIAVHFLFRTVMFTAKTLLNF